MSRSTPRLEPGLYLHWWDTNSIVWHFEGSLRISLEAVTSYANFLGSPPRISRNKRRKGWENCKGVIKSCLLRFRAFVCVIQRIHLYESRFPRWYINVGYHISDELPSDLECTHSLCFRNVMELFRSTELYRLHITLVRNAIDSWMSCWTRYRKLASRLPT